MSGDDIDVTASNAQLEKYRKTVIRPDKEEPPAKAKKRSRLNHLPQKKRGRKMTVRHWKVSPGISSSRTVLS
jgi:hypothetical protein